MDVWPHCSSLVLYEMELKVAWGRAEKEGVQVLRAVRREGVVSLKPWQKENFRAVAIVL